MNRKKLVCGGVFLLLAAVLAAGQDLCAELWEKAQPVESQS